MKCQEVMMYMQRQLDGDLTPNEEDELHAHLMHCLDCAEMFERLQALSDELSQLPKVMPPFSLVDAILPQLLEMDKQNGSPVTDNVVNFPPMMARTESVNEPKRSIGSRFKEQFSWKIASGVVAAGLIIGFFAFNMQHPLLDNADGFISHTSSDSKRAPEKSDATAGSTQAVDSTTPTAKMANKLDDDLPKQSNSTTPNADTFVNGPAAAAAAAAAASTGNGATGTVPQATANANLEKPGVFSPPAAGSDPQDKQIAPSTSSPARLQGTDSSEKVGQIAEGDTPKAGLSVSQSSLEPKATGTPVSKVTPTPTTEPSSADRTTAASQGIFSLSRVATELKSTTGVYQATVEEAHVVIRNSITHEIVFESKHVWQADDQIRLLEWSKDDKLFYEVTSKGTLQTILIDLTEKTEANK